MPVRFIVTPLPKSTAQRRYSLPVERTDLALAIFNPVIHDHGISALMFGIIIEARPTFVKFPIQQHTSMSDENQKLAFQSDSPDSAATVTDSALGHSLAKIPRASNIASEILLDIIEKATYEPENEEIFSLYTYGPRTRMLHPEHKMHLRQYSEVNRWWRTVIREIGRGIYCSNAQTFRTALSDLAKANIRSIPSIFWNRRRFGYYDDILAFHTIPDNDDRSSPQARKLLFEEFLRHLDGGMRDLILLGSDVCPTLDVKIHGAWHRVRHFHYGFSPEFLDCFPIIASVLREVQNLESLHLEYLSYHDEPPSVTDLDFSERPTYSLKSLEVIFVKNPKFVAWVGGNSRGTLEELIWSPDDGENDVLRDPVFEEDLSDVLPGGNLLSLRRLGARGTHVQLIDSCNLEVLRWINFETNPEFEPSFSLRIGRAFAKCKNLERLWVDDNHPTISMLIVDGLKAGLWPAMAMLRVRNCYRFWEQSTVTELEELCKSRNIRFLIGCTASFAIGSEYW